MDLQNSVLVLTHQAALAPDYMFAVAAIALLIFCASVLYKARTGERLRRTGERHDTLSKRNFGSAKPVTQRPLRLDSDDSLLLNKTYREPHRWTHR
jgi:hypothetical protein